MIGISGFFGPPLRAGWIPPSLITRLAAPSLMIAFVFMFLIAVGGGPVVVVVVVVVVPLVAATVVVLGVEVGVAIADEEARKSFLSKSSCWSVYCA